MPAFIFDLDGTLVDTVYPHALAWHRAFDELDMAVPVWRIHRRIGMSGSLLVADFAAELGRDLSDDDKRKLGKSHTKHYLELRGVPRALPGAPQLLDELRRRDIAWAIATSSEPAEVAGALEVLDLPDDAVVIDGEQVEGAKPDPEMFQAAAGALEVDLRGSIAVGDATWDIVTALKVEMTAVGVLCGGTSADELERAGAAHVYDDPEDLLRHLDDVLNEDRGTAGGPGRQARLRS
jgi:HAD superfamily hydrolase (TIGR01509 family)